MKTLRQLFELPYENITTPASREFIMFEKLQPTKLDPILVKLFQADPRSEKVDLGIGVYKDDEGITPIMSSVKKAETGLLAEQSSSCTGWSGVVS